MSKRVRVFVYGTLKRGQPNEIFFKGLNAKFIKEAKTKEKYALYKAIIPYLKDTPKIYPIEGEIWELPLKNLSRLDQFEGAYIRRLIDTTGGKAYAYFYKGDVSYLKPLDKGVYEWA